MGQDMANANESNQIAVVTGGARGIGLAIGQWFLAHGYNVALLDVDRATLAATEAALALRERVLAVPCDVSNPAEVEAAAGAGCASSAPAGALAGEKRPAKYWRFSSMKFTIANGAPVVVARIRANSSNSGSGRSPRPRSPPPSQHCAMSARHRRTQATISEPQSPKAVGLCQ